jgi:hypothetical protein
MSSAGWWLGCILHHLQADLRGKFVVIIVVLVVFEEIV